MSDTQLFTALADPTRRNILLNLAENSPRTATQLAKEYPISRPGIIKHLNILQDAGLVSVHQKGREKRYTFTPEPLSELEMWVKQIGDIWEGRLLRLKTMIESENRD